MRRTRREFFQLAVTAGLGAVLAGCSRAVAPILEPSMPRPVFEGMGELPETFMATADGDYDFAVLRLDDGRGRRVGFFTPWWSGITVLTQMAYVRQQFRGLPFGFRSEGQDLYLVETLDRASVPGGDEGWRFVIHQSPYLLPTEEWEAIVYEGNFGLAIDDTPVPRHGVTDFRWGLPL